MNPRITPVILCGGIGTRLWPLSRATYPKQFAQVFGETSLFQETIARVPKHIFGEPLIVTSNDFRFIVTEQLAATGRAAQAILVEPEGKNTAPAVLAAALWLSRKDPEGLMLICPSDHAIMDQARFLEAVDAGVQAARRGSLVTFGIRPTRAETGYGWLEVGEEISLLEQPQLQALLRFVEKPDAKAAASMLARGNHLWNSGIFLFSIAKIIEAFREHQPTMLQTVRKALDGANQDLSFTALDASSWSAVDSIAIDYAVMEKAHELRVVPVECGWSDLGSWDAVARQMESDAAGVSLRGQAQAIDCENTLLRAEAEDQVLVGIGLRNVVAIAMHDAVLVADIRQGQRVKEAVEFLRASKAPQADALPRCHRPWGWYETLAFGERFQVKRIMVHPGGILSLQSHYHRAEHWVVVKGTARVTSADETILLTENQSIYIPLGTVHRLENPGKFDLHLIEVQSGAYLGEDDIVRYEDVYSRK